MSSAINSLDPKARERLASRAWRWRNSSWQLWTIATLGFLTVVGFAYIGVRGRHKPWLIFGIVHAVLFYAVLIADDLAQTSDSEDFTWWGGSLFFALWAGAIAYGAFINRQWLVAKASTGPWFTQTAEYVPQHAVSTAPLPAAISNLGVESSNFYGSTPAPAAVVDVNTASAEQLASLPGFDSTRALRVVEIRAARKGFATLEEFAAALELAPHELVKMRDAVTFGSALSSRGSNPSGRVLDF